MFAKYYTILEEKLFNSNGDPLEAQKKMVNSIQQLVGIRNVFGDKGIRKFTVLSVFLSLLFGCTFVYVGSFSQLVFLYEVLPDKVLSFQAVNCMISTQIPLSKFVFMFTSSGRLRKIMKLSHEGLSALPKNSRAQRRMASILRKARIICWLVIMNQAFTHLVYLLLPFFLTILGNQRYLPTMPGDIYGMVDKYATPYYEMSFVLTIIATLFSVINQTGYIILFITLLGHELGHFYAICETLEEIHQTVYNGNNEEIASNDVRPNSHVIAKEERPFGEGSTDPTSQQERINSLLVFCAKHHQFIMGYHSKIAALYEVIFGVHFLIMVVVLVTTLQTMNSWGIVNTLLTGLTGVMPLVVYCFGGEMLISSGLAMADGAYYCGWEGMTARQARTVLLILSVSQYPLSYTAAGMFIMNRETFGDVVQVVYKIYAVFN